MEITRWFNHGNGDWQPHRREIEATLEEQRAYFSGAMEPHVALPNASEEDILFLKEGCCCHPSELPPL